MLYGIPDNSGEGLVETLRAAPRVRWVQARNAGAGEQLGAALALDADPLRDVTVTNVSGIHAGPLAEFALLGLLAFPKRLPELARDQAARPGTTPKPTMGVLAGRTVLVVGLGEIGRETARLARAFGMHVLGVKRTPRTSPASTRSARRSASPSWRPAVRRHRRHAPADRRHARPRRRRRARAPCGRAPSSSTSGAAR